MKNRVAVLIVAYLGVPEVEGIKLKNSHERYLNTKKSYLEIKNKLEGTDLYVGLVGSKDEARKFKKECSLNENNCMWFAQDELLYPKGTGALENQLILNCINFWSLEEKFDLVIKITGKYDVINLDEVLKFSQKLSQPFYAWKILFKKMVDTRVFLFNPNFFLQKQIIFKKINSCTGFWMENIAYQLIKECRFNIGLISYRPILKGLAGTTNVFSSTQFHKRLLIGVFTQIDKVNSSVRCKLFSGG